MACVCCGNVQICCCEGSLLEEGRVPDDCDANVTTASGSQPRITTRLASECAQPAGEPVGTSSAESPCATAQIIIEFCGITLSFPELDPTPDQPHPVDNTISPRPAIPYCRGNNLGVTCFVNERTTPSGVVADRFDLRLNPYFFGGSLFLNGCGNRCVISGLVDFSGSDGVNDGYNGRVGFFRRDGCDDETIIGGQFWGSTCNSPSYLGDVAPCSDERPVITATVAP
jgi:hypothetical protein